jgi:hypothetical protein
MTNTQMALVCAYETALVSLTGIKVGIEDGVKQAVVDHQDSRTEEFNTANRAQLESGKPGCLD